jgi:transposase, IS5 family
VTNAKKSSSWSVSKAERGYGWDRTRLDGKDGAAIWCGHGVSAHNLVKIGALAS